MKKFLKPDAVPSQFNWKPAPNPAAEKRAKRALSRDGKKRKIEIESESDENTESSSAMEVESLPELSVDESLMNIGAYCEVADDFSNTTKDDSVQTDNIPSDAPTLKEIGTQSVKGQKYSIEDFRNDPKGMQYYTGLESFIAFFTVLASLGPAAHMLNYWNNVKPSISVPDQFLLILWKLRRYTPNFELARAFNIPESDVYGIFVTWIRFMRLQWQEIDIWPAQELVSFSVHQILSPNSPLQESFWMVLNFQLRNLVHLQLNK